MLAGRLFNKTIHPIGCFNRLLFVYLKQVILVSCIVFDIAIFFAGCERDSILGFIDL